MPSRYYSAIAQDTTLTSNIDSTQGTMAVGATTGFPSFPFVLAVDYNASGEELVLATGASGLTLTVTRGYNGTTKVAHGAGAVVRHVVAAIDLTDAQTHYDASTGVHGVTGAVAGVTDTQTLTNKTLTAPKVNLAFNAQTGTTYTLVAADQDKLVTLSNSSAITLTVPSGVFSAGNVINIQQIGAGQVTLLAASGVTITSTGATSAAPALRAQFSAAAIICTSSNVFTVIGDIV